MGVPVHRHGHLGHALPGRKRLGPVLGPAQRAPDALLRCFWLGRAVGVLPAFGRFTGMHPITRQPGDRVYAIAGDMRTMPGLAKHPAAERIDLDENGEIVGLS